MTLSLSWTVNLSDGLNEFIQFAILTLAFVYGARLQSPERVFIGLAVGVSASSLIVLFHRQGITAQPIVSTLIEGLFGNRNILAETATLTLIGCIGYRLWWFIPGLLPAILIQPFERASFIALIVAGGSWLWSKSKAAAAVCILLAVASAWAASQVHLYSASTSELVQLWRETLSGITLFGHGLGSYYTDFPYYSMMDIAQTRPEHAHNDILELAFETGIVGACLYCVFIATALGMADGVSRSVLAAFVTFGMFAFPWHIPTSGFIAALMLGNIAADGDSLWLSNIRLRTALRPWHGREPFPDRAHSKLEGRAG
jgi:hypothetical protein